MARKSNSTISQEELYPLQDDQSREELDDARMVDLDVEQESPFLRGQKRVSVRRGSLPKKTATRLTWAAGIALILFICTIAATAIYSYGEHSWRFRVESSDDIEVTGLQNVTHSQVMEIMGGDIGRNIFFIPLAQRKLQLEQVPWVESASVMRFVPNRLKVEIHERTPVAFARIGSRIQLIDAGGTLMDLPGAGKKKYSFPVILGMNSGEPLSTRAARMKLYNDLTAQLDSNGGHYSQDLSEVDLSDADDVKILANNPDGEVLVHLGSSDYLSRYKIYEAHVQQWRQEYNKLESVDLRYDRQVIVNPELGGSSASAPLTPSAAKAAMAAGVRPASLITRISHSVVAQTKAVSASTAPKTAGVVPVHTSPVAIPAQSTVAPGTPVPAPAHIKTVAAKPVHRKSAWKPKAKTKKTPATAAKSTAAAKGTTKVVTRTPAKTAAKTPVKPVANTKSAVTKSSVPPVGAVARSKAPAGKTLKPSPSIAKEKEQDHP